LADAVVKRPLIWPRPPVIGSRITGALMTSLSSTIANGLPTLASLTLANAIVPFPLKLKLTTASPSAG